MQQFVSDGMLAMEREGGLEEAKERFYREQHASTMKFHPRYPAALSHAKQKRRRKSKAAAASRRRNRVTV